MISTSGQGRPPFPTADAVGLLATFQHLVGGIMLRRKSLAEFFWARVEKTDGCWLWTGRKDPSGYGVVQLGAGMPRTGAHRASWELHFYPLPVDADNKRGTCVLHHCDTPACVRPKHLFIGDRKADSHDAQKKGRLSVPEKGWLRDRSHCPRGHSFNAQNTYAHNGVRLCRSCRAENERAYKRRKNAKPVHDC